MCHFRIVALIQPTCGAGAGILPHPLLLLRPLVTPPQVSLSQFYSTTLISNLCTLLSIDTSRVKIVSQREGCSHG